MNSTYTAVIMATTTTTTTATETVTTTTAATTLMLSSNMASSLATTPATTPTTFIALTTPKRLCYASPSTSVICEEVFDETCQPSAEEIYDYAILLGIDPVKESHLLYLAKEGLMAALPVEWKICYSEEKCGHYYYNIKTKQSQWDHPLDAVYRELVENTRQKYASGTAAATPIVDNSDDASQLDSGIRSMQGTDLDLDNTATTTNEMSSPVNNGSSNGGGAATAANAVAGVGVGIGIGITKKTLQPIVGHFMLANNGPSVSNSNANSGSTSGFSGGVSRFLESRTKNFSPIFMPVKNTRFEVAKTNPQISFAMKFGSSSSSGGNNASSHIKCNETQIQQTVSSTVTERKGFQLSGSGAMFLKSRRQIENGLNQASALVANGIEHNIGTPPGVKGILRDASLTDVRRRFERDDYEHVGGNLSEENKRVRFNLEETKMRASPEEEPSSSRKLTQSPEVSINSDDDAEGGEDDDLWDEDDADDGDANADVDDNGCVCAGSISLDSGSVGAAAVSATATAGTEAAAVRSNNPFLSQDEKHMRDIKMISLPKSQTIQMLKAQSFSIDVPEREHTKLNELARSQSVEMAQTHTNATAANYLDKLKDNSIVKPLYEDTDSDSKGSSVRSFIINKSEQDSLHSSTGPTNPFDLDELGRKHSRDVEQLQRKLNQTTAVADKTGMRTLKIASKFVGGILKKDNKDENTNNVIATAKTAAMVNGAELTQRNASSGNNLKAATNVATIENAYVKQSLEQEHQMLLKEERERMEEQLQQEIDTIKREHELKLKNIRHEYDLRLTSHQHQLEEAIELQLEEYRTQLEKELDAKRKLVVSEHKARMTTLQTNHAEILQDLERDLKSEEEILKKEHASKLIQMRDKLAHELEMEKHRLRESGEERLYEKVRCEKRLLEDKYRCLKEKYVRLKTDVKLSLERRNRRREAQAMHHQNMHTNTNTTTGSETERSISNKPSIGNSENRSLSYSTSCQERGDAAGPSVATTASTATAGKTGIVKPPVPPKTHLTTMAAAAAAAAAVSTAVKHETQIHARERESGRERERERERSVERIVGVRKPSIVSKYIKHLQVNDDTTSLSQSDTTISNNYAKGRYLAAAPPTLLLSDNGNSDSEAAFNQCNHENNNNNNNNSVMRGNQQRKKVFSRTKSASTSRLNSDNYKIDRPCTPVENLRHQLQKLEDLEDQFPDNTLDTTYHLRYPFTDISNNHAGGSNSSELEFFKHRIHLERDSVRRAKESLRTQRTNFRARQREIKQRHKTTITRHSLDQLIQEEKELTEMEVNLHRTRALLGEKVIRLRHLEQSLLRIYEKEKPNVEMLNVEQKDDATLSDLSSHSSSGFSSTDFASGADMQNLNKRREYFQQESNECIQNLEILNAEIREILDILGQRRAGDANAASMSIPMISPSELSWSNMLGSSSMTIMPNTTATFAAQQQQQQQQQQNAHAEHAATVTGSSAAMLHAPQSIPTLADRLETYRQLAAGRMQTSMGGAILAANTIVSQSPRAVNYTTSLVERTRDLRNWLRQAKTEHELLVDLSMQHANGMATAATASTSTATCTNATAASLVNNGAAAAEGAAAAQTNL